MIFQDLASSKVTPLSSSKILPLHSQEKNQAIGSEDSSKGTPMSSSKIVPLYSFEKNQATGSEANWSREFEIKCFEEKQKESASN